MTPQFSNGLSLAHLGERIRQERLRRQLSLEVLSGLSGVSRSMLSDVENGNKIPSVLTLDQIATALGTSISRLMGEEKTEKITVLRHSEQDVASDSAGWERRILSPVMPGIEFEFMRTTILPGVDAGTFNPHAHDSREYVAVEQGVLQLTLNGEVYLLQQGDSIYYSGDCYHSFVNPGEIPCVYYLVMELTPQLQKQSYH